MLKTIILSLSLLSIYSNTYTIIRSSSTPYISGDSFRAIADHVFDETDQSLNPQKVSYKNSIFVKSDLLDKFFINIHPHIQNKYFLITHNSDAEAPGEFKSYLDDDKILAWFGQNPSIIHHKKFIPIPIGIANKYCPHGKTQTFDFILNNKIDEEKKYLLGINFNTSTNFSLRNPIYNFFSQKNFCSYIHSKNHQTYLELMQASKFIISPEGHGLDCYRTWEALTIGTIPIVQSSMLDPTFSDLPVVIINDWQEVTEEFLYKKYEEIQNNRANYNYEKLSFAYWLKLINHYRNIAE